ncbi:Serine/threonine-protein kinase [Phytophthora cactorum]|nr:Serine/threonine-protein kinase [Phytophthora cactorum]KAG2918348.1 Serine/threonine-protein kinase [Phytophthora cactorum]KAG2931299.1 Serine/threonine-protein kinase [Phytophthora cactorum]KAG2947495.1 Serine/threonine-protein kinase [Phytophthora cactorum]KAG2989797.1 Serine/threonine-protein kinase [Phytophthora cactorum]
MAVLDDQDCGILVDDVLMAPPESEHTNDSLTSTGGASGKGVGDFFRRHDQCSQTIFSTIDELNEWIWTSEKKRLALSASAASRQTSASGRSDVASEIDDDHEKEYLEEFLKGIPSRSLSNAAYQIKAYARAVQYFEVHLRQEEFNETEPRSTEVEMAGPVRLSLVSKNATYLQQLYKSVDEPDSLIGLASLRRLHDAYRHNDAGTDLPGEAQEEGLTLTDLMHEIVDHEQLAQWEDALACYEQAIQEIQSALSSRSLPPSRPLYSQLAMMQPPAQILDVENAHKDPDMIKPELYGGMISCLIQLGRLESALQHINGIVTQEPQFMATMYPYALECSWRLSRWELLTDLLSAEKQNPLLHSSGSSFDDTASTRLKGFDVSQLMLVRVLHSLHGGQREEFQRHLRAARLEVMRPLAAASAESYQRAYPLLHDLHFLHEAEQGFIFLQNAKECDDLSRRSLLWKKQTPWKVRYDAMATQLKYRDPILALRRVVLHEAGLLNEVSENWLLYAKLTRKEGFFRTAASAVMHAQAMDNQYAPIEKAKLLVSQDRVYEALQILEPVDIDASTLDFDVDDPHLCAKNLLLATNWMQKSGQRQGKKVIERYQAVIRFDPTWEKGYFFLAKYYEYLLNMSHPDALNGSMSSDEAADLLVDSVFHGHLISLMKNYVLALAHGTKFVFQSLPRLLTLWFDYGEVLYGSSSGRTSKKANKAMRQIEIGLSQSTNEHKVLTDITQVVDEAIESLPAYEWLVCFPQVTSRICHPNPEVVDSVKRIMIQVLLAYPTQAMWSLLGLSRSLNSQRRNRAREIISSAQQQFLLQGLKEIADSFSEGMKMAEELISLAAHDPGNSKRKIHIRLSRIRTRILVPIQAALTTILPTSGLAPRDEHHVAFSSNAQIYIKAFSDKADVMMTKEKPKRIEILGTDGQLYPFLCKREKNGDLRKDARMMEFNSMINRLLQKDREGRKRKLRLRTYAVVCLNEESGLMEWVRHTRAMRQLIGQIHKTERGYIQPVRLTHEIKEQYLNMQKKYANNPPAMARFYCREVLSMPVFTPRFHQWFYNNFADPTAWFEARLMFSRSAAVWSMVGHIVGLGDRHGENILIDCTNGECVHVDFDCLFDKGLKLTKPEIVPFRLTPNIIDAFGITGYEGVFRRVSEVTMQLLRENKATLRSVLESFIHDPLVEWGRRGKATQSSANSGKTAAELSSERSKQETRLVLKTIDDRLRGIYNLGDAIRPLVSSSHRNILPENETLPLSVQGQVDKLIHEATSHENLAQMYIGWMPFL